MHARPRGQLIGACLPVALLAAILSGCSARVAPTSPSGLQAASQSSSAAVDASQSAVAGLDAFDSARGIALVSYIAAHDVTSAVSVSRFDAASTLAGHAVLRGQLAQSAAAAGFGGRNLAWLVWRQSGALYGQLLGYEPANGHWTVFEKPVPFEKSP